MDQKLFSEEFPCKVVQVIVKSRASKSFEFKDVNDSLNLQWPESSELREKTKAEMKRLPTIHIDIFAVGAKFPRILLERWTLHFDRDGSQYKHDPPVQKKQKMMIVIRTLVALMRNLPTNQLVKLATPEDASFELKIELSGSSQSQTPVFDAPPTSFVFSPVASLDGTYHLSVLYRKDPTLPFVQSKPVAINQHIIVNYLDHQSEDKSKSDKKELKDEEKSIPHSQSHVASSPLLSSPVTEDHTPKVSEPTPIIDQRRHRSRAYTESDLSNPRERKGSPHEGVLLSTTPLTRQVVDHSKRFVPSRRHSVSEQNLEYILRHQSLFPSLDFEDADFSSSSRIDHDNESAAGLFLEFLSKLPANLHCTEPPQPRKPRKGSSGKGSPHFGAEFKRGSPLTSLTPPLEKVVESGKVSAPPMFNWISAQLDDLSDLYNELQPKQS